MAAIFGTAKNSLLLTTPEDEVIDVFKSNNLPGNSVFSLKQILPNSTLTVFDRDGDTATTRTNDYGLIPDFNLEEGNIRLAGTRDYFWAASAEGLGFKTTIYLNHGDLPEPITRLHSNSKNKRLLRTQHPNTRKKDLKIR